MSIGARKNQDRTAKSHKRVIFHLFGEKPPLERSTSKLCSRRCPRRNHVCQVSKLNFQGLRVYMGVEFSIFLFIFEWALQQCSATELPMITVCCSYLWSPYGIGQTIIFSCCGLFFFPSFFFLFFSSPNLSGRRFDVYHTLAHGVALVRIQNAGLKCAARGSLQIQDAKKSPKIAISAPSHNFVGLYLRN